MLVVLCCWGREYFPGYCWICDVIVDVSGETRVILCVLNSEVIHCKLGLLVLLLGVEYVWHGPYDLGYAIQSISIRISRIKR